MDGIAMKPVFVELHGVTFVLDRSGEVEASTESNAKIESEHLSNILLFFLLREIQALNGALRDAASPNTTSFTNGIFPS
jgi:hypothetical protein